MIKSKYGRVAAFAGLALAAGMMAASPANAFTPEPIYDIYYFNDAAHTTQVGYDRQECFYWGIGYSQPTQGQATQYAEYSQYATCDHGVLGPL